MKNSKNKRTIILVAILLGLLVVAYKVMFVSPAADNSSMDENIVASARVEAILQEVSRINFDISIKTDPKFQSLKSIEIPLISLPVGRENPFSNILGSK
jgi:hypothetical protein